MARYRYSESSTVDGKYLSAFRLPTSALGLDPLHLLDGVKTVDHVFQRGERLDQLAAKHWGEDSYWWIIALVNEIKYPFPSGGLAPGKILKIPVDVKDIFEKIYR